jgi:oxaloacetate decarboxylase alpha subunit
MLTNLENQLKEQNALDKFDDVIDEIPNVRSDLGFIPLVTPTSQIVGTQAVINVINNERYKVITKETAALLKGEYGKTPSEVDKSLQEKVLRGGAPITCRPADMIDANEYKNTKEKFINLLKDKNLDIETSEENILTYTLFPEIGFKFLENKDNQDFFEKSPTKLTQDKEGYYNVEIDDSSYLVKYSKTESPEIIGNNETLPVKRNEISKNVDGTTVNAPLGGNIFSIEYSEGSSIKEDDTVIVLEAMKMETTIKTPVNGTIKKIFVKNGDKVQAGEPLFEVVN